jgi:CxxC motif-containing protein
MNIVCFLCPNSCRLAVTKNSLDIKVENNLCPRGVDFAIKEITDPERILTSTIKVVNGELSLVSVRSDRMVKKEELRGIIQYLDTQKIKAPVISGQIILSKIGKNKVNIIATRTIK